MLEGSACPGREGRENHGRIGWLRPSREPAEPNTLGLHHYLKRKVVDIHASDEERRRQRKEKFPTAEPRQFENEEHRKKGMGVLPQSKGSWEPTFKLLKQK